MSDFFSKFQKYFTPKVTSVSKSEDTLKSALKVKQKIVEALAGKLDEGDIPNVIDLMRSIPAEVYASERMLSYSISDLQKYLGDADSREKDKEYDAWFREKLSEYLISIDKLISRHS